MRTQTTRYNYVHFNLKLQNKNTSNKTDKNYLKAQYLARRSSIATKNHNQQKII